MTMDGLETLPPHRPHSALLLSESAAFNVLSFDTCLYKGTPSGPSGGSPVPAASGDSATSEPAAPEPQQGDLNTPVTTSGDIPSFFGPSTVVEPPPITGEPPMNAPVSETPPRDKDSKDGPGCVRTVRCVPRVRWKRPVSRTTGASCAS